MRRICILLLLISVSIQAIQSSLSPNQCGGNANQVKLSGNTAFWKLMTKDTVAKMIYILSSGNRPQYDCDKEMNNEISNNNVIIDEIFLGPPNNLPIGNFGPPMNDPNRRFFMSINGTLREVITLPNGLVILMPGSTENPKNLEKIETSTPENEDSDENQENTEDSTPENIELSQDNEDGDGNQDNTENSTPENIELSQDNDDGDENQDNTENSTPENIELSQDNEHGNENQENTENSTPGNIESNNQDFDSEQINTDYYENPGLIFDKNSGGPFKYNQIPYNPYHYPYLPEIAENQENTVKAGRFPFSPLRTFKNADSKQ